jgi:hypothetical protein
MPATFTGGKLRLGYGLRVVDRVAAIEHVLIREALVNTDIPRMRELRDRGARDVLASGGAGGGRKRREKRGVVCANSVDLF